MFVVVAICIVAGFLAGSVICGLLQRYMADSKLIALGLVIMLGGSLALGWLDYAGQVSLVTSLAAISTIYVGLAFVIPVATSLAVAPFDRIAGSASALLGSVSMALASASTLLIGQLPHDAAKSMSVAFTVLSIAGLLLTIVAMLAWGRQRR
jgi:DHA1 family bicyclomycin/chloramphenicol resistance-like MFS transporter